MEILLGSRYVEALVEELSSIGIRHGDTVLVRAALSAMRSDIPHRSNTLIQALLATVGSEGTVLGLSFGRSEYHWLKANRSDPYDAGTDKVLTGGFASAIAGYDGAVRSWHPTNSFVAIGNDAALLMARHDHRSSCFAPMADIIARNGKMLLVGCTEASPGFSTVHLAQYNLGLSTRNYLSFIAGRYRKDGERTRWWRKADIPGCSMGFSKFYPRYRKLGLLREGQVGSALSYLISAKEAYQVEFETLQEDPSVALCDRDGCLVCRLSWSWKAPEVVRFLRGRKIVA